MFVLVFLGWWFPSLTVRGVFVGVGRGVVGSVCRDAQSVPLPIQCRFYKWHTSCFDIGCNADTALVAEAMILQTKEEI